jgi:hypothetical protein
VPWWYRPILTAYAVAPGLVERLSFAAMKRQKRR